MTDDDQRTPTPTESWVLALLRSVDFSGVEGLGLAFARRWASDIVDEQDDDWVFGNSHKKLQKMP